MANISGVYAAVQCALQKCPVVYAFNCMYLPLCPIPSLEKETEKNRNVSSMGEAASGPSQ